MRACDQSSIFSTGGKFCPDYGLLLELHALTLVARSYALLITVTLILCVFMQATLQFCIVKPIVAVATIILEACNVYHEGTLRYVYKISNE